MENTKTITFPLYNKAFKALFDSDSPLLCFRATGEEADKWTSELQCLRKKTVKLVIFKLFPDAARPICC